MKYTLIDLQEDDSYICPSKDQLFDLVLRLMGNSKVCSVRPRFIIVDSDSQVLKLNVFLSFERCDSTEFAAKEI